MKRAIPGGCLCVAWAALAAASVSVGTAYADDRPEVEPNDTKASATFAIMGDGDTLSGTTTGAITTTPGLASADYFRLKTTPRALGIYRHRLLITTGGGLGHIGTIRGLNQTGTVTAGGTIGAIDSTVQSSSTTTVPARFCEWYGFGREEELYFRIVGTSVTTSPYLVTHEETPVMPIEFPGLIEAGNVTIERGAGNGNDTDFWVYDANLRPIPLAGRDDGSPSSILTVALVPGTYYLALSSFNLANDQLSPPGETFFGPVLEFPDAVANSLTTAYPNMNMKFTSVAGTVETTDVAKTDPFQVLFIRFTVAPAATPSGACCVTSGSCSTVSAVQCAAAGSSYLGNGTTCEPNPCPQPGACCFAQCCLVKPAAECQGAYQGNGSACTAPGACVASLDNDRCVDAAPIAMDVPLVGANCGATKGAGEVAPRCSGSFGATLWYWFTPDATGHYRIGTCGANFDSLVDVLESNDCQSFVSVACDDDSCAGGDGEPGPVGPGSTAASVIGAVQLNAGRRYLVRVGGFGSNVGIFQLLVTPNPNAGACCDINTGACRVAAAGPSGCGTGEAFVGGLCSPSPCVQPTGACCRGSSCWVAPMADCAGANQQFVGVNTPCNFPGDPLTPCCLADYNHVGGITVQDIFDFLAGYFGGDAGADINGGGLSVQDIFDFLGVYFSGGC